ncbi:MAG: type II toxin-antitoxin system RelE/ParE family toxin [Desulfocapsaceae bacterium]
MIKTFADKQTEKVWNREFSKKLPTDIQKAARRKLIMVNAASVLSDLKIPPNNQLEKLSKDRKGQHSIRINDQWRVCFRFDKGDAYEVEVVDYRQGDAMAQMIPLEHPASY